MKAQGNIDQQSLKTEIHGLFLKRIKSEWTNAYGKDQAQHKFNERRRQLFNNGLPQFSPASFSDLTLKQCIEFEHFELRKEKEHAVLYVQDKKERQTRILVLRWILQELNDSTTVNKALEDVFHESWQALADLLGISNDASELDEADFDIFTIAHAPDSTNIVTVNKKVRSKVVAYLNSKVGEKESLKHALNLLSGDKHSYDLERGWDNWDLPAFDRLFKNKSDDLKPILSLDKPPNQLIWDSVIYVRHKSAHQTKPFQNFQRFADRICLLFLKQHGFNVEYKERLNVFNDQYGD
ncbi:MAG: hypothetical protein MK089_12665, partial [Phycisphaerales bacterium]|nr:hypothetical protein [Phycisphaerales bacterium]